MLLVDAAFVSFIGSVLREELDDLLRFRKNDLLGVLAREEVGEGREVLVLRDENVVGDLRAGVTAMLAGLVDNVLFVNLT
jgi:hypothetical protein